MTDINQNFSLNSGDETEVLFDIGPDEGGINLDFVAIHWRAYNQHMGVPDMSLPIIEKTVDGGIEVTDPLLMKLTVTLDGDDTAELSGNYYHEIKILAPVNRTVTTTTGLMTCINPAVAPNVIAFKAMFPDFEDVEDTLVQIALDAAGQFVDEAWGESQIAANMYLAAHFLSMAQAASGGDTTGQVVTSESIGRIHVSYAASQAAAAGAGGSLGQTTYGIVFGNMLTAQGYGIAIV